VILYNELTEHPAKEAAIAGILIDVAPSTWDHQSEKRSTFAGASGRKRIARLDKLEEKRKRGLQSCASPEKRDVGCGGQ
jgi:hypothetical protein